MGGVRWLSLLANYVEGFKKGGVKLGLVRYKCLLCAAFQRHWRAAIR